MPSPKPALYLIGPIYGCNEGEAKNWRQWVTDRLPYMRCISPLRCEPMIGKTYDTHYADPCFGHPRAILAKNFLDMQNCDMSLAYLPKPERLEEAEAQGHKLLRSIGSIGEISWAYALRKPCVVVSDDPLVHHHPFTSQQPGWPVLPDLEHAVRLLNGLWTDYAA